ncbi:antA/AntB antirepressor family protein [Aliarcobacter cryaerophilus]|uniref:antA/AntB antirepressor family protein n=1 Tax=Aliarcobacter cryaerophilus TaxID=28198 RepID=UPI00164BA894|nr:antA/AntB antirepressor family protein [Aliarcobacter cryaerophilus]QNK85948.1 antA/AntB antirepressor family protein [Aliarcobacter cryaerophilus]
MREIIKISSEVIGTKKINSVNARELHQVLDIKKQFTHWIDIQINSLGLEKNVDYIVYEVKGNGRPQKEYIITTDTAKHISMASRTAKGKEVRNYFIQIEKEYFSPNIQQLSGRVGGLTKANNDLRKELDKFRRKSKRRFENLEDDVDELKSKQFLITHKSFDEKLDLLFKRNKEILNRNTNEFNRETFIKWLQEHNVFYGEYLEILRTGGSELQRWAINQFENEKKRRVEAEKELYKMKYRYEKTLNKISDLQKIAKNIVDFDMEIEREMNMVDF